MMLKIRLACYIYSQVFKRRTLGNIRLSKKFWITFWFLRIKTIFIHTNLFSNNDNYSSKQKPLYSISFVIIRHSFASCWIWSRYHSDSLNAKNLRQITSTFLLNSFESSSLQEMFHWAKQAVRKMSGWKWMNQKILIISIRIPVILTIEF